MNKTIILVLSLICCILMLISGMAHAGIQFSKHDLSITNPYGYSNNFYYYTSAGVRATPVSEICIFCHTPHNAAAPTASNPGLANYQVDGNNYALWNRNLPGATGAPAANKYDATANTSYTPYTSPTMTLTVGAPTGVSLMCMSCHDGVTGIAVGNNTGTNYQTTQALLEVNPQTPWINSKGNDKIGTNTSVGPNIGNLTPGIGGKVDLSNDHPVSFSMDSVAGLPGLYSLATIKATAPALRFFGLKHMLECSTCHSVHDPTIPPFLAMDNSGSAMCLACHNK